MNEERHRKVIVVIALAGLAVSVLRLWWSLAPSPEPPETPRAALAQDMELFETTLFYGSPYSAYAYAAVQTECKQQQSDPQVAEACTLFQDGVHNTSDEHKIDDAVRLLREEPADTP